MMPYVYGCMAAAVGTATAGGVAVCVTVARVRRRADDARYDVPFAPARDELTEPDDLTEPLTRPEGYKGRHRLPTIGEVAEAVHFPAAISEVAGDRQREVALRRAARKEIAA